MKTTMKNIPMLLAYLFFTSCGNPVSKESIEKAKDENARYKVTGEQMRTSSNSHATEQEKLYQGVLSKIDPAKRKDFDKDTQLKEKISTKLASLKELNNTYKMFSDSIVEQTSENEKLITSFVEQKSNKKEAEEKWTNATNKVKRYQDSSAPIMKEIEEKEKEIGLLYDLVNSKYGVKAAPVSKNKKKR